MLTQRVYRYKDLRLPGAGALTANGYSDVWDLQELSEGVPQDHIGFEKLGILIRITAVGGTTPTLAVALSISENNTDWEDLADSLTGLNAIGVKTALVSTAFPARYVRLKFALGGTAPSFTLQARVKPIL